MIRGHHNIHAMLAALASLPPSPGFAHDSFREIRTAPRTFDPPQTEQQKQWYLNRAAERRARRAAKKQKQEGGAK